MTFVRRPEDVLKTSVSAGFMNKSNSPYIMKYNEISLKDLCLLEMRYEKSQYNFFLNLLGSNTTISFKDIFIIPTEKKTIINSKIKFRILILDKF